MTVVVCELAVPSRARSGITRVLATDAAWITGDDHVVEAHALRTGALLWRRAFGAPALASLLDANGTHVLLREVRAPGDVVTRVVRAHDGVDERTLDARFAGSAPTCLGRDGSVAIAWMRSVELARPGEPPRSLPIAPSRFGAIDAVAFDVSCTRLALGTRAGEALELDFATGETRLVLDSKEPIRAVGFVHGAPWAIDSSGHLAYVDATGVARAIELAAETHGGLMAEDGASFAMSDAANHALRVRSLGELGETFATSPGFVCSAVGIADDGALVVGGAGLTLRLGLEPGAARRVASFEPRAIRPLPGGAHWLDAPSPAVLAAGGATCAIVGGSFDGAELSSDGARLIGSSDGVVEEWDLATSTLRRRVDLAAGWLGETNEAIRTAHDGPDGKLWVHLTNGWVHALDGDELDPEPVRGFPSDGNLVLHPSGRALFHTLGRTITELPLDEAEPRSVRATPVDADVITVAFSPSGRRMAAFHRNRQVASFDLERPSACVLDAPATSAAERAPNEVFVIDVMVPLACAWSRDERRLAWTSAGRLRFADVDTGATVGEVAPATDGGWLVTDGASFDWGPALEAPSTELVAREGDVALSVDAMRARRVPGLLATLT